MSSPTLLIDALRDHLDLELGLYRRWLALEERKQRFLVADDLPAFRALLDDEEGLAAEAAGLRQRRERLVRAAADKVGLPVAGLRLVAVVERLPEHARADLLSRRTELTRLLKHLRELQDRNQLLIRQGLALVQGILRAVLGDQAPAADPYDRTGTRGPVRDRGRLVDMRG